MNWLKAIRIERGMTQNEVAHRAKIAQPTYTNIETGKRNPSVMTAKLIADILGFDWTEFFEKNGQEVDGT